MRLRSGNRPIIRETLDASSHADSQARIARKVRIGSLWRNGRSIHTKVSPCAAGAGWSQIRASMLLGTADERGRNTVRPSSPGLGALPPALSHEIDEGLSHRGGRVR